MQECCFHRQKCAVDNFKRANSVRIMLEKAGLGFNDYLQDVGFDRSDLVHKYRIFHIQAEK